MSSEHRKECLHNLKAIGYQTGCGIMAGSPYQTTGPYCGGPGIYARPSAGDGGDRPIYPSSRYPFKDRPAGTLRQTLLLLAIVRLMLPDVLLPATTALGTIEPDGREQGVMAGANVVMPNLSPMEVRKKYMLYDNKISTGMEVAANIKELKRRMASIGDTRWSLTGGDHKK